MNVLPMSPRRAALALCSLLAALPALPAMAADKSAAGGAAASAARAPSAYDKERALCLSGKSQQDRATCLREAENARADARQGGLDDKGAAYGDNASQRCGALSGDDKQACIARMKGEGTVSGDVKSGGILRERVERGIPVPAASKAGSGAASSAR